MKDDLRKYVPDVAKVLEESRPEALKERQRKALEKLREAGLVDRATPEPATRTSAPSPWGKGNAGDVDRAVLPSAMTPATDDPAPYEVSGATEEKDATRLQETPRGRADAQTRRTRALFLGFAVLAVAAPLVVVLAGHEKPKADVEAPAAPPGAQTAQSAKPVQSATPEIIETPASPQHVSPPAPSAARINAKRSHQPSSVVDAGVTNKPDQGDDIRIW